MKNPVLAPFAYAALFLGCAVVTGCGKSPTGQVVAVVNGDEVTLQEVNNELGAGGASTSADKTKAMQQAVERIVERRLLAQAAKKDGLDRDPAYLNRQRRANEQLLIEMYLKRVADALPVPDAAAVNKYIAAHPVQFGTRTRFTLDQVIFPAPDDLARLKDFEGAHTLDAVIKILSDRGTKFERNEGQLDSGNLSASALKQITNLPAGEPFIVPTNGRVVVSVIKGTTSVAMDPEQARPLAIEAMRNEALDVRAQARLKEARSAAKIDYQAPYGPTSK